MSTGRILATEHRGAYALKLVGDVRVDLCSAIEEYFRSMFSNPAFESVTVDLCEAEGMDSTTLGLLAKLALQTRERYGLRPVVYSCNSGINRLLESMGLGRLLDIRAEHLQNQAEITEIPSVSEDPEAVRMKVLEAHRVLMDISEENRERFSDLVTVLEQGTSH
ncbi:MAG: STAS domain-containing protein [Halieaceae bacterium]|jgi:anti-anti-sigma factor|nr:STAS domain-containing protein [Halieaceae bacterium]